MSELVKRLEWSLDLPTFRQELQRAEAVPDVKRLRDMADAGEVLARRQGLTAEAVLMAEGKLWAERRLGEVLDGAVEHGGSRSRPATLKELGLTKSQSSRWQQLASVGLGDFEDYLAAARKRMEPAQLNRLLRIGRENKEEEEREPSVEYDFRPGDFRDVLGDLDGKVDAIITDPPYPAEFLGEFDALSEVAARILKPGGILAAMVGQTHLPEYIRRLSGNLDYRWCGALTMPGPAVAVHPRKVRTKWKPLLIFGGTEQFLPDDLFIGKAPDKRFHHWGQSEELFLGIVERLTKQGQLVVDPFLGGGTTAIVCQDLGRAFIGCDVDPEAIKTAKRRLAEYVAA